MNNMKDKIGAIGTTIKNLSQKGLKFASKHKILTGFIIILILLIVVSALGRYSAHKKEMNSSMKVTVQRRDIEESISDSTVVEPNSEYSITASVSGEIIEDYFEEGDQVQKDDLMYSIDSETILNNIESADIAIARAKKAYEDAVKEDKLTVRDTKTGVSALESAKIAVAKAEQSYSDALRAAEDLNIKANHTGYVTDVHVSVGDTIGAGTPLADITDSGTLKIDVPFNSADVAYIYTGASAVLTLTGNGATLIGTVTGVNPRPVSGDGYTLYNYVTIEVNNPGAVSSGDTATAVVDGIACGDIGTFENKTEDTITASSGGKIALLYISEGSYVRYGDVIALLDADSVNSQINIALMNLKDAREALTRAEIQNTTSAANVALGDVRLSSAVETAKLAYDDALLSKENLLKQLDDYTIRAPISGTVVTKNKKKGDNAAGVASSASSFSAGSATTMSGSTSSSSAMAVIYDMSRLKCTLDVDELDIKNVRVGQRVSITTDVSNKEYVGVVDTVSIGGTAGQNGVTTFPVKIEIINFDDNLLPGMNIEAKIVLSSLKDVLAIPVSSLNRGNTVYVKGSKTEESDTAPDGYKTVKVITGVADDEYIQVVSGLNEGDELYAAEYNAMEDMLNRMEENRENMRGSMTGGE